MLTTPHQEMGSVLKPGWSSRALMKAKAAPKAVRDALCGTEAPHFIWASFAEHPRFATRASMCFSILLDLWEKCMETKHIT